MKALMRHKPSPIGSDQPTIWIDVADFLEFFRYLERPTGIQRVEMQILTELARFQSARHAIRFCRLEQSADRFEAVDFETLARVFYDPPLRPGSVYRRLRRFLRRSLRTKQLAFWRPAPLGSCRHSFRPGDLLVCLGTSWENPRYVGLLRRARELGVRIAVLIHDIIPVDHPGFVEAAVHQRFGPWLEGVLSNSDLLLTNSEHSCTALLEHAAGRRLPIPAVEVVRFGTGFPALSMSIDPGAAAKFPLPFVLYVSTIEVRKNHALLLRVWRRLIDQHGSAAVPSLVFVGRVGWLGDDVMAELSRGAALREKVVTLSGLSDAHVAEAYRQCLFTVFPSLMEGWGLPVEESLERGKMCVASDRGAICEVAGDLVDYFDAADEDDAFAAIERAIFDIEYRNAREAQIRAEFRPRGWADCVATLMVCLEQLVDDAKSQRTPVSETAGVRDVA